MNTIFLDPKPELVSLDLPMWAHPYEIVIQPGPALTTECNTVSAIQIRMRISFYVVNK